MAHWTFDIFHIFMKTIGETVLPNSFQNGFIYIREAAPSKKPQPELFKPGALLIYPKVD